MLKALKEQLGHDARNYNFNAHSGSKAIFQYKMHTLPEDISDSIGIPTLFAAWNAAIYVALIDDQKFEHVQHISDYLDSTAPILHKRNGPWFNDESFVVSRQNG